ncbi:hypothetical protein TanjilG_20065 [Lupinus angustifolius]|uniref:O-fucosyltransferase family protein n=1 Tax=Lupinus angustifolius TaxID=3871 RepID=A0A4P1RCL8_LUPAN|nr:PREDICTED: uncharacterized protein LOC109352888 [Lupinus angustifolius]OIW07964.1 hypothetical protein TanjilG_20065 [Lupinus angustifolius]
MAKWKNNAKKLSYISVPSHIINSISSSSLQSLFDSSSTSKKSSRTTFNFYRNPRILFFTLFLISLFAFLKLGFNLDIPFSSYPCGITNLPNFKNSFLYSKSNLGVVSNIESLQKDEVFNDNSDVSVSVLESLIANVQLQAQGTSGLESDEEIEFWKKPNGMGYKPCLDFSRDYRRGSEGVLRGRKKYLMVVVSGGMNQQRNQIVDAVVIARILGAALVVPILQVNVIWGDESEFADIFDLEYFKSVLANDVRVVSALPSTHCSDILNFYGTLHVHPYNSYPPTKEKKQNKSLILVDTYKSVSMTPRLLVKPYKGKNDPLKQ